MTICPVAGSLIGPGEFRQNCIMLGDTPLGRGGLMV